MGKANTSDIESGVGFLGGFLSTLMGFVREGGVPFEAIHRLGKEGGRETVKKIVRMAYADWLAEQPQRREDGELHGRGGMSGQSTVLVADLFAAERVVKVEEAFRAKGIPLTYLNEAYRTWDYTQYRFSEGQEPRFIEVRDERYEVLTWKPGEYKTTQQIRDHFSELNADGNTAAFLTWIMETHLTGSYVSIPSEDALLWRDPLGDLCAPFFYQIGGDRTLGLCLVGGRLDDAWVFVAFRKLPR